MGLNTCSIVLFFDSCPCFDQSQYYSDCLPCDGVQHLYGGDFEGFLLWSCFITTMSSLSATTLHSSLHKQQYHFPQYRREAASGNNYIHNDWVSFIGSSSIGILTGTLTAVSPISLIVLPVSLQFPSFWYMWTQKVFCVFAWVHACLLIMSK